MSSEAIYDFLIDEVNEEKMAAHGISVRRVLQVLDNTFLIVPNRAHRRAPLLLIGTDSSGACLAIPIEPTHEDGLWRPVTAWPCKDAERAKLR